MTEPRAWIEGHSQQHRQLMIRAVAAMSADCQMPDLTRECPFMTQTAKGPVCAEECVDLVAQYPDDLVDAGVVRLGGGVAAQAQRVRPRRDPAPDQAPFDARSDYLADLDTHIDAWRFTSLLVALRECAMGNVDDRMPSPSELLEAVSQRGLDGPAIVRLALGSTFAAGVVMHLVEHAAGGHDGQPSEWLETLTQLGWIQEDTTENSAFPMLNDKGLHGIFAWFQVADPHVSLAGGVPAPEDLKDAAKHLKTDREQFAAEAEWVFDRFTETYLDGWSPESLKREWRYQNAQLSGCCPPAIMRQRLVSQPDLASRLANLAITDGPGPRRDLVAVKNGAATAAIRGDLHRAVTLFEYLHETYPDDLEVQNNLAFCLIPDNPARAEVLLQDLLHASSADMRSLARLNLAVVRHHAGRKDDAKRLLLDMLDSLNEDHPGAHLWDYTNPGNMSWQQNRGDYAESFIDHLSDCACATP